MLTALVLQLVQASVVLPLDYEVNKQVNINYNCQKELHILFTDFIAAVNPLQSIERKINSFSHVSTLTKACCIYSSFY